MSLAKETLTPKNNGNNDDDNQQQRQQQPQQQPTTTNTNQPPTNYNKLTTPKTNIQNGKQHQQHQLTKN